MTRLTHLVKALTLVLCFTLISAQTVALEVIRYPRAGPIDSKHLIYPLSLLKLAISKIKPDYQITPSTLDMKQGRALKQLALGFDIDVLWTMSSAAREKELTPIRIPIYKGLIGWRVFLINQNTNIDTTKPIPLKKAKELSIIQGHDWPDTEILRHNQFNVQTSANYEGLFKMLRYKRADLFPRSIVEVWDELKDNAESNIKLEQHTLISYPAATYYFVSNKNKVLANIIRQGLEIALKDGSFDALFNLHYSDIIKKAQLNTRAHYRLENPLLSEDTPLANKRLWFSPSSVN
jgi:hypothetical protein